MELNEQQQELRFKSLARYKGRSGIIRNPFYTNLPKDTKVYVEGISSDAGLLILGYEKDSAYLKGYCFPEEVNLIDKEYSGSGMILKGVRTERKDKYGNSFIIELLNDGKSIYISQALSSLLLCNAEENYIGFASDPEIGEIYIFNAKTVDQGYLLDKKNNRIVSPADHRELSNAFHNNILEIYETSIINPEFPDMIFYKTKMSYYVDTDYKKPSVSKTQRKGTSVVTNKSLLDSMRNQGSEKMAQEMQNYLSNTPKSTTTGIFVQRPFIASNSVSEDSYFPTENTPNIEQIKKQF